MNAIKRLSAEIASNEIGSWQSFFCEEKAKKLQSDFERFDNKSMAILCDNDNEIDVMIFDEENREIEGIFFDSMAKLRAQMANMEKENGESQEKESTANKAAVIDSAQQQLALASTEIKVIDSAKEKATVPALEKFAMKNWHKFEKEFREKIESNDELKADEKFMALSEACENTVAFDIVGLAGNDYKKAFEKLKSAFGTAYKQAQFFMQKLLSIPKIAEANGKEIMTLIGRAEMCVTGMKRNSMENCEQFIPFLVIEKLDGGTRMAWERHNKILSDSYAISKPVDAQKDYLPDWKSLKQFLEDEAEITTQYGNAMKNKAIDKSASTGHGVGTCEVGKKSMALETAEAHEKLINKSTTVKNLAQAKSNEKITLTSAPNLGMAAQRAIENRQSNAYQQEKPNKFCECVTKHPLHKCFAFKALNISGREEYILERGICAQCLQAVHIGTNCLDPLANRYCARCWPNNVKHNSMLCVVSYEKAQKQLAIVTPIGSTPQWSHEENWN